MQPLAVGPFCMGDSLFDQGLRNPLALERGIDHGVQDKSMHSPIPRHVHEPDQRYRSTNANPSEAEVIDLGPPVVRRLPVFKAFRVESVDLRVLEGSAPFSNSRIVR